MMIELGTPKQKTTSWTKLTAYLELNLVKVLASFHIVNLSTVTSKWVKPSSAF
jgi:hypothetical protein